ncbi:MAG: hypothetical protein QXJ48_04025 [Candidatus Korarchaeum sp.]
MRKSEMRISFFIDPRDYLILSILKRELGYSDWRSFFIDAAKVLANSKGIEDIDIAIKTRS